MEQESALVTAYYMIYEKIGSKIAFASNWSGNYDIWMVSVSEAETEQLIFHETNEDLACWSPDFRKSLELNLQNTNAKEKLKKPEKK
jgi:Tol biopolymer transport system component